MQFNHHLLTQRLCHVSTIFCTTFKFDAYEVSSTESVEEKKEETETKKEEKKETTSFDENQQQAINAALANAGLGQEDVTDIGCTLDEATQQYTVTFTFQDIHNTAMVDAATFSVLSSVQS